MYKCLCNRLLTQLSRFVAVWFYGGPKGIQVTGETWGFTSFSFNIVELESCRLGVFDMTWGGFKEFCCCYGRFHWGHVKLLLGRYTIAQKVELHS